MVCAQSLSDSGTVVAIDDSSKVKVFDSGYKRRIPNTACNLPKLQEHLSEQIWRKQHEDDLWFGLLRTLASTKAKHRDEVS